MTEHLLHVPDALARLRNRTQPAQLGVEIVFIDQAQGRILAEDLVATLASPPFDAVAVDGWAFAHQGPESTQPLVVVPGRAAAGHPFEGALRPGQAVRVLTGAPLPLGADTVAPDEACHLIDGRLHLPPTLAAFANRRRRAEDVAPGERLLPQGHLLRPQDLGLAVQLGHATLPVFRRLRVALASSGDELREPGQALVSGAIYDSNRAILRPLLTRLGVAVTDLGILGDDAAEVARILLDVAQTHEAVVVSGGASASEADHVARTIAQHGELDLWRLAMKPGRPLALGRLGNAEIVGLPGNPVAATVAFVRFARPLLLRLAGAGWLEPQAIRLPAASRIDKRPGRTEYLRGCLIETPTGLAVACEAKQGSAMLGALSLATGLIELPAAATRIVPGDPVAWLSFTELGLTA
ncbi:MAG: molybdopterin molybdenumtransferase MoeA [Geminicoccaceae bacterium]|nr:MAG: molybdopterin molybdenumtransferase MoeA [Geminicoccaceae bacterium]